MQGAPVALWRRQPHGQDGSAQEQPWQDWLATLVTAKTLDEWEEQVHASRRDAACVYGSHVTLICDSPRKLPPDRPESSRATQPTRSR